MTEIIKRRGAPVKFSQEDDAKLISLVGLYGIDSWIKISKYFHNKSPKQCRDRWTNYLDPTICRDSWTEEEDSKLVEYSVCFNNHWKTIAKFFPNRTGGDVRYRFLKLQRRRNKLKREKKNKKLKMNKKNIKKSVSEEEKSLDRTIEEIFGKHEFHVLMEAWNIFPTENICFDRQETDLFY